MSACLRFYEADAGRILLDGADYRELSRDDVRRSFGMVLQDTWLFAGRSGTTSPTERKAQPTTRSWPQPEQPMSTTSCGTLPDGYSTVLDEDAANISSGQRQLLTIARAFLSDPAILILDEATSNVDTRTEVLIQEAMARLRHRRTSFVIAHRLSTIRDANTIVVMDGGRIVEQGHHADLLRRRGLYHSLYNSQFTEADISTN